MPNLQVCHLMCQLHFGVVCAGLLYFWWNILNCTPWTVTMNTWGEQGGYLADFVHASMVATESAVCSATGELPFCFIDNLLEGNLWLFSTKTEEERENQQSCRLWSAHSVH